ncbi:transcriptional regulator, TetR family [Albimonas donghaensis]|uniref:Transcriptional regulator, TetR family n=2 Tax=Albimonas donghaensis TaxID=356660 RepID=A0A1H3AF41_9RHOB|nr:transcriptional regulator, TetR family [Albimonas donghaensis]
MTSGGASDGNSDDAARRKAGVAKTARESQGAKALGAAAGARAVARDAAGEHGTADAAAPMGEAEGDRAGQGAPAPRGPAPHAPAPHAPASLGPAPLGPGPVPALGGRADAAPPPAPAPAPDPAEPPARRAQAERRRESDRRMLRAAITLIARHGAKGASLAQIGLAAGYSRGLPAERFGAKLALLGAVMDASLAWFDRYLESRLAGKSGLAALRARVLAHGEGVRDSSEAAICLYQLMVDASGPEPELAPRVTQLHATYREGFLRHLREAEAAGELRDGVDLERTAGVLLSIIHGLCLQHLGAGDTARLPEDAVDACDRILRDISAP